MAINPDSFSSRSRFVCEDRTLEFYRLPTLVEASVGDVETLPYSLRILLENLLRHEDGATVFDTDVESVASWDPLRGATRELQLNPVRVLMQDFAGVPVLCDLAAMRDASVELGRPASDINPLRHVDLVVDHSVHVDEYGTPSALRHNARQEYQRNRERFMFLRWGQHAFANMRIVPPGVGICHQVNLEYLSRVVWQENGLAYPDSLVGTDSHTTMVNGLGVFGWGVGGLEAEAVMLGQSVAMLVPDVVGFELTGQLPTGATTTDLVLTVTQMLRKRGVVGKFVEFCGPGLAALSLPDRATIANMAPEYGATMGFFPIDDETLAYLRITGRDESHVQLVERYCKENLLWRDPHAKLRFSERVTLDLATIEPSIAGPTRPHDRVPLGGSRPAWRKTVGKMLGETVEADGAAIAAWADGGSAAAAPGRLSATVEVTTDRGTFALHHGSVVIAAITSCTSTSNPSMMLGAGLLAKKAVARGLSHKPWVKTSLAPGSWAVTDYLAEAGVLGDLAQLGFHLVGYGCTTCIGNSGPISAAIEAAVKKHGLVVCSVLSGNRNFESRINPIARANYLASPPLVVAYALAGTMNIDFEREPLGIGSDGQPVFLRELWPSPAEVTAAIRAGLKQEQFGQRYERVFGGDNEWDALEIPTGGTFRWDEASTFICKPPYLDKLGETPRPLADLTGARVLAVLGDSVTTDHIAPVGDIAIGSPAAKYLEAKGVPPASLGQYGSRRGNSEVTVRGTFANIQLKNRMVPGIAGGFTKHLPDGVQMTIFDAAMQYMAEGVPLVVIAGEQYGAGSSRDSAAKGKFLLGVRAVIAKSFERIHRSNLIGMGILPLEFEAGEGADTLGLTGDETITITGITAGATPNQRLEVIAGDTRFHVSSRIDTRREAEYFADEGILRYVLRRRAANN